MREADWFVIAFPLVTDWISHPRSGEAQTTVSAPVFARVASAWGASSDVSRCQVGGMSANQGCDHDPECCRLCTVPAAMDWTCAAIRKVNPSWADAMTRLAMMAGHDASERS